MASTVARPADANQRRLRFPRPVRYAPLRHRTSLATRSGVIPELITKTHLVYLLRRSGYSRAAHYFGGVVSRGGTRGIDLFHLNDHVATLRGLLEA